MHDLWRHQRWAPLTLAGTGLVALLTGLLVEGDAASPAPAAGVEGPALVAAGDIGDCSSSADDRTATLVRRLPGTVMALGDLAYESGSAEELRNCYGPTWGTERHRTRPVVGNHEYHSAGAAPYFAYWGAAAGETGKGWYSFDLGEWHVVALNSNCEEVACDVGSEQEAWLRADLAASARRCTLVALHHPPFSSASRHGPDELVRPLFRALHEAGADVLLAGHDHVYERFAPLDAEGHVDEEGGVRAFVVGTGGRGHDRFNVPVPGSQVRDGTTFGVLVLRLGDGRYSWRFEAADQGASFSDSGTDRCR